MLKQKIYGATLIELMVVIAILSGLAVYGVVTYKSYTVKSKFTQVLGTMSQYKDDAQAAYTDNDQFPTTFSGLTASTFNSISSSALSLIYYGRSTDKQSAYLNFYTTDLGVTNYVAANSGGAGGAYCRVAMALVSTAAGHMQFYCGQWDGSSTDVPLSYLPKSCQNTNISALIS